MEEDGGSLGDCLSPKKGSLTPQLERQTASENTKAATGGAGAGCSTPRHDMKESGGVSGGGGGSVLRRRGRPRNGTGGTGTGPKFRWSKEETVLLWECVVGCDVSKGDGAIKRVIELYNSRTLNPRNDNSINAKVRSLKAGGTGLSKMEKEEIEQRVRQVESEHEVTRQEVLEVIDMLEESYEDGYEFRGFEVDVVEDQADVGDEGGDRVAEEDGDGEVVQNIDFVVEGSDQDIGTRGDLDDTGDTWKGSDGSTREVTVVEMEVLKLMREVLSDEKTSDSATWDEVPSLRGVDKRKVTKEVDLVDGLMHNLLREGMSVNEVNTLLYVAGVVVARRLGLKVRDRKKAEFRKPWWQRRIERSIGEWRKDLSRIEEIRKGTDVGEKVLNVLERRYQLRDRGALSVISFLKGKIKAGSTKIRWFVEKKVARRQNTLFKNNQSQLYKELGGTAYGGTKEAPDAAGTLDFWGSIWSAETEHDTGVKWLTEVREKMEEVRAQDDVVISFEDVKAGVRRMANWKAPGPDGVRGFWFKKLPSLLPVLTVALQEVVSNGRVPAWMVKGRTVLIQKDPAKGKAVSNYRPIACLPLMWKLLTGIFAGKIYDHLQINKLLPDEQKGCRKGSRGAKDQLLIDKAVLKEARAKKRCLSMMWIDYRKAYDMLPHSWILESLQLTKVAKNIKDLLEGSMPDWKTVLTANGETLGEVSIRRGIFQGDSLSPLLFIVAMIPLTMLLKRETNLGYHFGPEKKLMNHLLFMDDLKLYGKNREELDALARVVHKFSTDIRMEFGIDKCAVLVLKAGVKEEVMGFVLPDGQLVKEVDEKGYRYLGVLEGAAIKTKEMKDLIRNEYLRRVKLVARSKLYAGNLVKALNVWAVSVVRYTAGVLEWTNRELKAMDVKTRKVLCMNGAFHMRSSVDRLYMKRKVGGRGLMSVVQCVESEKKGLEEYVMASDEWMLKATAEVLQVQVQETKVDYVKRIERERSGALKAKKLHGKFFNGMKDVDDERSWQWLRAGYLGKTTEAFVCAAQEQVLKTRLYEATIMKVPDQNKMCRVCGKYVESVGHLVSACKDLAQGDYLRRHDKVGLRVYWELCGKLGVRRSENWYEEVPDGIRWSSDGRYEIWWNKTVYTTKAMKHNRPDLVVIDKVKRKWSIVDFSVPFDANVVQKEEKLERYGVLAKEVRFMHGVSTEVVPIVVGALGVVSKRLAGWLKGLGIPDVIGGLQTSAIVGTAAILRKVLCT